MLASFRWSAPQIRLQLLRLVSNTCFLQCYTKEEACQSADMMLARDFVGAVTLSS